MDNLVKDNYCKKSLIRGTHTIESISAGETKVITLEFQEELSENAVCVCSGAVGFLNCEVLSLGNASPGADHKGYVILNVTNPSETGEANASFNYAII